MEDGAGRVASRRFCEQRELVAGHYSPSLGGFPRPAEFNDFSALVTSSYLRAKVFWDVKLDNLRHGATSATKATNNKNTWSQEKSLLCSNQ
jgi:hypothetical protein